MKVLRFRTALTASVLAVSLGATTITVPQATANPQLTTSGDTNVNRCVFAFTDEDKAAFEAIDKAILQAYKDAALEIRKKFPQWSDDFAKADQQVAKAKDNIRELGAMKAAVSNYKDLENKLWYSADKYRYGAIEHIILLPELADDLAAAKAVLNYQPVNIALPTNNLTPADLVPRANLRNAGEGATYDVEKQYKPIEQANKKFFNLRWQLHDNDTERMRSLAQQHWAPVNAALDAARKQYSNADLRRLGQECDAHFQGVTDSNTLVKRLGLDKVISDAVDQFIKGAIGEQKLNDIIINALKTALGDKTADQAIADTVIKSMGGKTLDKVLAETVQQFIDGAIGEKKLHDIILDVTREALGNRPIDEVLSNAIVQSMGGKTLDVVINETIDQFMKGLIGEDKLNDIIQGAIREALGNQGIDDAISNTLIKSMGGKTLDKVLSETIDQFLAGAIGEEKLNDIIVNVMREALGNRPVDDVVAGMIIKSMGNKTLDKVAEDIIDKALTKALGDKTIDEIGKDLIDHAIAETSSTPTAKMLSIFAGLFGALGLVALGLYMVPLAKEASRP